MGYLNRTLRKADRAGWGRAPHCTAPQCHVTRWRAVARSGVPLLQISKKTFARIKLNLCFAFGYNCLGIPIAAGVLYPWLRVALPPWGAGLAMALSSVSIVTSSLLLSFSKPKIIPGQAPRDVARGSGLNSPSTTGPGLGAAAVARAGAANVATRSETTRV